MKTKAVKTETPVATPKAGKLKVKTGQKYRGARQAWYEVLLAHDGKPAGEFLEATTKKPPSVPKSGRAEAPSGWLAFFKRTGVAEEITQNA